MKYDEKLLAKLDEDLARRRFLWWRALWCLDPDEAREVLVVVLLPGKKGLAGKVPAPLEARDLGRTQVEELADAAKAKAKRPEAIALATPRKYVHPNLPVDSRVRDELAEPASRGRFRVLLMQGKRVATTTLARRGGR